MALITEAYGGLGGIAQFNRNVFEALSQIPECKEVVVYPRVASAHTETIPSGIDYKSRSSGSKTRYILTVLRAVISDRKCDLIICGHIHLTVIAYLLSRICRCPMLLVIHGIEAWTQPKRLLTRWAAQHTDSCIAVSRFTLDHFLGWSKVNPRRCTVVHNVFDATRFTPGPKPDYLLKRYLLPDGSEEPCSETRPQDEHISRNKIILTMARLASDERYKGIDEVMEVLPDLMRTHAQLVYLIVGDGDDKARLQSRVRSLGISKHVRFAGRIDECEKVDHYRLADVFVMPGRGEGFGIVYLEAMACGLPVVGSVLDGSREALLDGELGVLVNPDDRGDLIAGINTALGSTKTVPGQLANFEFQNLVRTLRRCVVERSFFAPSEL